MGCKERVEGYLEEHGVAYQWHHHPSVVFTAQEVAHLEHIPGKLVAKVVMAFSDHNPLMLVLPAPYWVDLEKAAQELGSGDLRLATEDEFGPYFPDCELGAMPPFGNLYGIPVYVDRSLAEDRTIFFQGGTHRDVIEMEFADFVRLADAAIVDVAHGETA
jgi:Ala-tRNA(Pro) deacylase